ncbi:hypothetical protein KKA14_02425 [bacterium]|nr:hypothetical protein [bacterium]
MEQTILSKSSSVLNLPEAISKAYNSNLQLNLNREDIAFIAGIFTYIEIQQNFSLRFSDLEKIYTIVNEIAHGNQDSLSQRTQNAVERQLKSQLLIRVDGGGMSSTPNYDMTRLGKAIVSFLTNNEKLTRQNLTIITTRITGILAEIRKSLESSGSDKFWEDNVQMPLRHVVSELLEAIEKRQRGLDLEQNEVRKQISELLEKDWLAALESCESLLQTTSDTLQELYRTLLSENTAIKQGLNEIYEQADTHQQSNTLDTIESIYSRLDQLEQWGKERVVSWSQYYRRVNDFLQSIIRFDPNREFSQKLKEQILTYPESPWYLRIIRPEKYRTLREIDISQKKEQITRVLKEKPVEDEEKDDDGNLVLDLLIEDLKKRIAQKTPLDLIEVIRPYLKEYPLDKVYPHIGTLTDLILKETALNPGQNVTWERPLEEVKLELQNLNVTL